MQITKITVGRLFNLGSYEHIRYEVTVEIKEGESATDALLGIEHIFNAINPSRTVKSKQELDRMLAQISRMRSLTDEEFEREFRGYTGTRNQIIQRHVDSHIEEHGKFIGWQQRNQKARRLLDDLGAASQYKDAKLDWETDNWDD